MAYQKAKKLPECINAYKNALMLNPHDEDARQNLQRALMEQKQQQQQNQKDQKQQNKNDQKKKNQKKRISKKNKSQNLTFKNIKAGCGRKIKIASGK